MIKQGDVIPYIDMCKEEGVNLQRGMNFRLKGGFTVILMSIRHGAPYADRIEEEGKKRNRGRFSVSFLCQMVESLEIIIDRRPK